MNMAHPSALLRAGTPPMKIRRSRRCLDLLTSWHPAPWTKRCFVLRFYTGETETETARFTRSETERFTIKVNFSVSVSVSSI